MNVCCSHSLDNPRNFNYIFLSTFILTISFIQHVKNNPICLLRLNISIWICKIRIILSYLTIFVIILKLLTTYNRDFFFYLGHSPIKVLKVLNISKFQDMFCLYRCEFYMPLRHIRSKCPTKTLDTISSGNTRIKWCLYWSISNICFH